MKFLPNNLYYVYNEGNNQEKIFIQDEDYYTFLWQYRKFVQPYAECLSWCLMPNHFQFLLNTDTRAEISIRQGGIHIDPVTNGIRKLLSRYCRIFNKKYCRSGSLFRQKTKSKCLTEENEKEKVLNHKPGAQCFHLIHRTPLDAGLVEKPEDWPFSSFQEYAGLRNGTLCNKNLASSLIYYQENNDDEANDHIIRTEYVKVIS